MRFANFPQVSGTSFCFQFPQVSATSGAQWRQWLEANGREWTLRWCGTPEANGIRNATSVGALAPGICAIETVGEPQEEDSGAKSGLKTQWADPSLPVDRAEPSLQSPPRHGRVCHLPPRHDSGEDDVVPTSPLARSASKLTTVETPASKAETLHTRKASTATVVSFLGVSSPTSFVRQGLQVLAAAVSFCPIKALPRANFRARTGIHIPPPAYAA